MAQVGARTFRPRRRGLSPERAAQLERRLRRWGLDEHGSPLDPREVLPGQRSRVLEIGFGNGQATIELAVHRPEEGVIAVDVHVSGISRLLEAAEQLTLTNVRVVVGDALVFLERLPSACLDEIRIFFPDPWPKRRHQHRRLIQGRVLRDLTDRLVVGGHLHLVTDIADYADAIELAIEDEPRLRGGRITRPSWRPETRYERAGIESGRTSVDLRAERIA